jgi:hypothetical protein
MKRLTIRRVVPILFWASLAASAADANGIWKLAYTTENGLKRESKLDLKVEGDSVSGTVSSERGTARFSSGKITGDEIAFDLIRNSNYDEITVHFKGRIVGDTMKLTMQYGKRDPVSVTGKRGS